MKSLNTYLGNHYDIHSQNIRLYVGDIFETTGLSKYKVKKIDSEGRMFYQNTAALHLPDDCDHTAIKGAAFVPLRKL